LNLQELIPLYQDQKMEQMLSLLHKEKQVQLKGLSGSSYALRMAAIYKKHKGFHLFILPDKESAAYLYNDLESLLLDVGVDFHRKTVMFYPSAYKRPYETDQPDSANLLSRTEVIARLNSGTKDLILVSFAEALSEKIVSKKYVSEQTIMLRVEENLEQDILIEKLENMAFSRVDFVVEPGQFAIRGGLMDVFSYAWDHPYRIEFFGDEIESIRTFDPIKQLSLKKLKTAKILPNLQRQEIEEKRQSFLQLLPSKTTLCLQNPKLLQDKLNTGFQKALKAYDSLEGEVKHLHPDQLFLNAQEFQEDVQAFPQYISQYDTENLKMRIWA